MNPLLIHKIRGCFPSLDNTWAYFDNAGGSQVPKHVGDNIIEYLYETNVQHGASYEISELARHRIINARSRWSEAINANHNSEVIFGPSTTSLLQQLSLSFGNFLEAGDEIIVTNFDHEANIGPWVRLKDKGIVIKYWNINNHSRTPSLLDLDKLISNKTKLVTFSHVSNVLGGINPVQEITDFVHSKGALVCVDGVAYAPHRSLDMQKWDVDFYVFSLYKVYGPHQALLYGKKHLLEKLPGTNHYFLDGDNIPYKFQPGNVNFELSYGCMGIIDYLLDIHELHFGSSNKGTHSKITDIFDIIAEHEEKLTIPLMDYLNNNNKIQVIGNSTSSKNIRVPTISFIVLDKKSSEIPVLVDKYNIAIRWGDFYARRLITDLGLTENDGVIRVSMAHYNTIEEVNKLTSVLDRII